ncbi:DNA repair protein rad2, partial [Kickxella alabastrina]
EPEEDVAKAHRETIFRKAQLLAEHAATGVRPGIQAAGSSGSGGGSTRGSQGPNKVQHIDSDADYISDDDDERSEISDDFINVEAAHGTSVAGDASPATATEADVPENNDGEDEDSGDDDRDAGLDVGEAEQNEYALFIEKLRGPANGSTNRGASYEAMRSELEGEMQSLRARVRNSTRDASGIGADMVEDIRMLLTLFGIPYVTAPMEAESQCAALVSAGLVDGMVTDDSDAFVFSSCESTVVYRHFFQKDRFVEMYSSKAIYADSNLAQRDLVFLAYLLGSDYTVGIRGIGPVLAMEALAEFGPAAAAGAGGGASAGAGGGASA